MFVNRNCQPYSLGKVVEYGLWPVQNALGFPRTGLHTFRHGLASEMIDAGVPLTVVQRQMRHKDASTTLRKYGQVVGDAQKRAANAFAEKIERHTMIELVPSAELVPTAS